MKKIKDMWDNNRILIVLASIILVCFLIIVGVCFKYFFGANTSSYGDRLEGIQNILLTDEMVSTIESKLKENDTVEAVQVHSQGKIIYIRIQFQNVTLDKAKEIANTTIPMFSDEMKENYDLHFTLVEEDTESAKGFIIMGSKNIHRNNLIWNNNRPVDNKE